MPKISCLSVLVLPVALGACSGTDAPGCNCGEATVELCDGSENLRFAGTNAGGNVGGVPRVAQEVGWSFLLIDGTCRYWTMTEPEASIRTGMLDVSQIRGFEQELELGTWEPDPTGPSGCPDASTTSLRFLNDVTRASCETPRVFDAYAEWLAALHAVGSDLDGEARYTVSDATNDGWVVGNNTDLAQPWPLSTIPTLLEPFEEETAEPTIASPEDAETLRAVRNLHVARPHTVGPWLRTPLAIGDGDTDTSYVNLAMRDVTPFERDGALALDDFFASE